MLKLTTIAALALAATAPLPAAAQYGNGPDDDRYYNGGYPGGPYPGAGYGGRRETITCESLQYQPNRCAADTRGGVRIVQQLGNNTCIEGRTWGFDRGGIWVANGCRAVFATQGGGGYPGGGYPGGPGGPGRVVICESNQYRPNRCAVDIYRGAQLIEDLSNNNCNARTWGWDRRGIWVNNGCRGRFRVF